MQAHAHNVAGRRMYVEAVAAVHAVLRHGRARPDCVPAPVAFLVAPADALQLERAAAHALPDVRELAADLPHQAARLSAPPAHETRLRARHYGPGRALDLGRGRVDAHKDADVVVDRERHQRHNVPVAPGRMPFQRRQKDAQRLRCDKEKMG